MNRFPEETTEYLKCPSCKHDFNENYRVPRTLPCGHPVCSNCLQKVAYTVRIQCLTCLSIHYVRTMTLPVDEERLGYLQGSDVEESEICLIPGHDSSRLRYYCYGKDCRKPVCAICVLKYHSDEQYHVTRDLDIAVNEKKSQCKMLLEKLKAKRDNIKKIYDQADNYESKLNSLPATFDTLLKKGIKLSSKSKNEMYDAFENYRKECLAELKKTKSMLGHLSSQLKDNIFVCEKAQRDEHPLRFLRWEKSSEIQIGTITETKTEIQLIKGSEKLDHDMGQVTNTLTFFQDEIEDLDMKITSNVKTIFCGEGNHLRQTAFNPQRPSTVIGWLLLCFFVGMGVAGLTRKVCVELFKERVTPVPVGVFYTVIPALLPVHSLLKMIFRKYGYSYSKWIDTGYMSGRLIRFAYFAGVVTGMLTCDFYWLYYLSVYIYNILVSLMIATIKIVAYILLTPFNSITWLLFSIWSHITQILEHIQTLYPIIFITSLLFIFLYMAN